MNPSGWVLAPSTPTGGSVSTIAPASLPADFGWFEEHLLGLFDAAPSFGPVAMVLAVLGAFAVGVVHAIGPGHGKAVAVGYLAGGHGRPRDAVALGAVVSLMHTGSVLVVGFALFTATTAAGVGGQAPFLDATGAWLRVVAGSLVALVGVGMLVRERRRQAARRPVAQPSAASENRGAEAESCEHDEHGHDARGRLDHPHAPSHDQRHAHDHGLERLPPDVSPLSRQGVLLIGASGGLLPSPAAFLVLATGLFAGRLGLALTLVAAFSVGLAVTIAGVGLASVWGRDRLVERLERGGGGHRLARWIPSVAAVFVVVAGMVTIATGVTRLAL